MLIAGDMTRLGDWSFRIALEIRNHAGSGARVGMIQAARPMEGQRVAPEIQTCVRRGLALVVDPAAHPATDLLVIHAPSELDWEARPLAGIVSERTILVCHHTEDFSVPEIKQRLRGSGELVWAPTNPWLRQAAPAALTLSPDDWQPPVKSTDIPAPKLRRQRSRLGWVVSHHSAPPPEAVPADVDLVCLDLDGSRASPAMHAPCPSLDRLSRLDCLAYFPEPGATALPDALILSALDAGATVALPRWLKPHYGVGPVYCEPGQVLTRARRKRTTRAIASELGKPAADVSGAAGADHTRPQQGSRPRPVMFLASNGVGIGHVSRLLAIARRMDPRQPVMFVTQAQAVSAIERLGYLAEYIPSASYVGGDLEAWDSWFQFELESLIDAYDPALVVYDGNNPSPGLVRAVASRADCRLAWVRRGLWGNLTSPFIDNARWFDLIVEPGELEGQPDEGMTAQRRDEAVPVPPIRLLDDTELLSRGEAAKAVGLDPARPSALIQLGAGYNRDIVSLIDHLVEVLQQVPQLQVSVAEWVNGAQSLTHWPDVKYLRGYPLSQYFNAFDFSIAAAGYNTFHETMSFGLPTIFIPNRHPSMDDQAGRALHAQNLHAAFELDEADLADLPELVTLLMDPKARAFLADNSRRLCGPNGAAQAAHALTEMLEAVR
ncbi:MAG: putative glycosyltransferase [Devosia sp.]|nr:putative glycosyltransferase [Devosia sp.]